MKELSIIPDLHGQSFWRDAVRDIDKVPVVFLGDYLDPYRKGRITPARALDGFMDILELKKAHPNQVTLLLGEHDLHYVLTVIGGWGTDHERFKVINNLFEENLGLFDIAMELDAAGNRYLFTHAGVLARWLERNNDLEVMDIEAPTSICERMNWLLHNEGKKYSILLALAQTGFEWSHWWQPWGSPIWAQITDHNPNKTELDGVYQIFGHTRQMHEVVTPYWACLDCGTAFVLDTATKTFRRKGE